MRYSITAFLMIFALGMPEAFGETQCSCPTVKADGVGNSSCSASESSDSGRCKIDFNEFGTREARAADILAGTRVSNLNWNRDTRFSLAPQFGNARERLLVFRTPLLEINGQLADVILLYLTVAAAGLTDAPPDSKFAKQIVRAGAKAAEHKEEIQEAFGSRQIEIWRGREDRSLSIEWQMFLRTDNVDIAPGCIEVLSDGLWMMYKAFWSPARKAPQCKPVKR